MVHHRFRAPAITGWRGARRAIQWRVHPDHLQLDQPEFHGHLLLELFGTGLDSANASQVTVTINGQSIPVLFAGAQQQYPGLDQINVGPLPASLKSAGTVNVEVSVNGQSANTVTLTLQ